MRWTPPATEAGADLALTRALAGALPGGAIAGPLLAYASVTSTQVICRRLADDGAPEGTVVLADHQTAGRGRQGREWVSPAGTALLFSCLLRPPAPPLGVARWPELTLTAGVAVVEAMEDLTGATPRLKWPNDVLIGGRKVAGILAEGVPGERPFVILGIGINLSQEPRDWPGDLTDRAASLRALGYPVDRRVLLAGVLRRLASRYAGLMAEGFEPVRDAWRRRAELGQVVPGPPAAGVAVDLAADGALVIRRHDGTLTAVVAGDALARSPAGGAG